MCKKYFGNIVYLAYRDPNVQKSIFVVLVNLQKKNLAPCYSQYKWIIFIKSHNKSSLAICRSHGSPVLRQTRRSAAPAIGGEVKPRQVSKSPQKRTHHGRTRSVDNKNQPQPPKLQRSNSVRLLNRKKNPSVERPKKSTTPTNDTRTRQITPGKSNLDIPNVLR